MFPLGQKKGKKGLDLQFYYSVLKKGRVRRWTWGCNSFKQGCEVFESPHTLISHHFASDVLWLSALWFKSLSSLAGIGPEPVSPPTWLRSRIADGTSWVPMIRTPLLCWHANEIGVRERAPEDALNGPLERVYDLLVIRGLSLCPANFTSGKKKCFLMLPGFCFFFVCFLSTTSMQ